MNRIHRDMFEFVVVEQTSNQKEKIFQIQIITTQTMICVSFVVALEFLMFQNYENGNWENFGRKSNRSREMYDLDGDKSV